MVDLLEQYKTTTAHRVRQSMDELKKSCVVIDESDCIRACQFITGQNCREQILSKLIMRYVMQIVSSKTEGDSVSHQIGQYVGDQMYLPAGLAKGLTVRKEELAKYEAGMHPVINTGFCQDTLDKVSATFKSRDQRFNFSKGEKPADDAEAFLNLHRQSGGFADSLIQADYLAAGVNASLVHVFSKGDWLAYDVIWPSAVRIVFGRMIDENTAFSGPVERPVDYTDLEDASAIIIDKGCEDSKDDTNKDHIYLAYVGACDGLPLGRMVTYTGSEFWPIPDVGDEKILIENKTRVPGEESAEIVCNPMTAVARSKKGIGGGYEYPLILLQGSMRYGDRSLMPTSQEFYGNCLDVETELSAMFGNCGRAARGIHVINITNAATRLPVSLDVPVMTDGSTMNFIPGNAAGLEAGIENALKMARGIASSRGVPGYMMVGPLKGLDASGIALYTMTQPLIDVRDKSIRLNSGQINKLPYIETALLASMNPATMPLFDGVTYDWNPGTYKVPVEPQIKIATLVAERDAGARDHVSLVQEVNNLATVTEAEDLIEVFKDRDPDYEPKKEEPIGFGTQDNQEEDKKPFVKKPVANDKSAE